ncbi:MAG: putative zinc-binding protein [Candidatus Bathyarchaeia archaeon]
MAEKHWQEGMKTHENMIYACFGCLSNTGITAGLGALEAVKELGLDKVAVGCLASLPLGVAPVIGKTKAAKKIITVDGCPFECSRKIVEAAGFKPSRSFMLVRDVGMKKKALHEDIGGSLKPVMEYVSAEDVERTKGLVKSAILEE